MNIITFTKVKLPYGWLGNMSRYPVTYEGVEYRTTEALFQALRFREYPEVAEEIRAQKSPMAAKLTAKKYMEFADAGEEIDNQRMLMCLKLKLEQHPELVQMLLDTGAATIIEDCTNRDRGSARYWGAVLVNGVWEGKNVLGNMWMHLREKLRNAPGWGCGANGSG